LLLTTLDLGRREPLLSLASDEMKIAMCPHGEGGFGNNCTGAMLAPKRAGPRIGLAPEKGRHRKRADTRKALAPENGCHQKSAAPEKGWHQKSAGTRKMLTPEVALAQEKC
jgi:hypothetical protein